MVQEADKSLRIKREDLQVVFENRDEFYSHPFSDGSEFCGGGHEDIRSEFAGNPPVLQHSLKEGDGNAYTAGFSFIDSDIGIGQSAFVENPLQHIFAFDGDQYLMSGFFQILHSVFEEMKVGRMG